MSSGRSILASSLLLNFRMWFKYGLKAQKLQGVWGLLAKLEYYGNYNFSYYSFFLRGYKGLKVVTICYYKYLYINIYNYIFIYTFLYLHFKSVILGQNKTVITEIVICNRFFSGIEMHTFIAPKTMTISSQSYEL